MLDQSGLTSAKDADAQRRSPRKDANHLGGALDTAAVLRGSLEPGLERLRAQLEKNILERAEDESSIREGLQHRYDIAKAAKRTGLAFELWRENEITQAAVAWLLGCVFVRFLEDNLLIDQPWISGVGERLAQAKENNIQTYRAGLHKTDRDYLLLCFDEMAKLPDVAGLFDKEHNPLYRLSPTGHGARAIIDFFQRTGNDGSLLFDFTGTIDNTRFLGDLYQNISESARKRYALVQTPDFVVDFILDRTMTPALEQFGLEGFRLIDPACGSGHFLLDAFDRLFHQWQQHAPDLGPVEHVNRALASVYGVDLNPFAVAIARFRLLIAALRACEVTQLRDNFDFKANLAIGDSLLHGRRPRDTRSTQRHAFDTSAEFFYQTEDAGKVRQYLSNTYSAVVANPPYITVSDPALREKYRDRFGSASGKYQLSVPFTERCFDLAANGEKPGHVGMITSNAFMKRTFGRRFVEKYIPLWEITHVIDTSGVYLPGHGTPTTIMFGLNRSPKDEPIRVVRGIRGETSAPDDPAQAPVWSAILKQIDCPGSESKYVSVADAERSGFYEHPWSIGGGGAAELREILKDRARTSLREQSRSIGYMLVTGEDDAYILPTRIAHRSGVPFRPFIEGDDVQDWTFRSRLAALTPDSPNPFHWSYRVLLRNRKMFGKSPEELGKEWFSFMFVLRERLLAESRIAFADVATHARFVYVKGPAVFNRHAPVVLPRSEDERDRTSLTAFLNSSTVDFLLKQVCFPKGGDPTGRDGARIRKVMWDVYYEYDSTKLSDLPLPAECCSGFANAIQQESESYYSALPQRAVFSQVPDRLSISECRNRAQDALRRMIALQEELDWEVYHLYGLTKESMALPIDQVPEIELGQRAFEIAMARQMAEGELETEWFNRHGSTPITEMPTHWPEPYRQLVQKRLDIIANDRDIALIEQPEYKRRWNLPKWENLETEALKSWLLDRLEDARYWPTEPPLLRTVANLAAAAGEDAEFMQLAELYTRRSDFKVEALVSELVEKESIPFLPILRYKPSGLIKRKLWEETWALQRREDAGEKLAIQVPPKYEKGDFATDTGWKLRGKLDVAKERWVSYPHLERNGDSSLLIGWAGYDHAQQAIALATYYQAAREDGWSNERLIPILTGIQELLPWVLQWHNQPDATGTGTGDFLAEFLRDQLSHLNFSEGDIRAWTPPQKTRAKPAKARKKKSTTVEVTQ